MARRELSTLAGDERQQLVNLMLQYITDGVLEHHEHINHWGANLLEGYRDLIRDMETWLAQNGGG